MGSPKRSAFANLTDGVLEIGNSHIVRRFLWNGGNVIGLSLADRASGVVWPLRGSTPDFVLPGETGNAEDGKLQVKRVEQTARTAAHLCVEITFRLASIRVRRRFRIYDDVPAIACDTALAGHAAANAWRSGLANPGELSAIETKAAAQQGMRVAPVVDRLETETWHWRHTAVRFFDVTDRNNNLVAERSIVPYARPTQLVGSLLLCEDRLIDHGIFMLQESPLCESQLAWPGVDFISEGGTISVLGLGIDPTDLKSDEWTDGYSVVFGVASGGGEQLCRALRQYQLAARVYGTADQMIVVNTWGDRNRDTKLNDAFVRQEMTAAADLGATHLQLDDGWQSGRSGNSAFAGGTFDGIWDRDDYWSPHPQKFPAGFKPLIEQSQQLGVEIGLWFNPSKENDFAHWRDDAEQIVRLHREQGICLFKIDGVDIPSKAAERNLSQMLEYASSKSDRAIRFNLDVTAGRRFGYFVLNEYGNKFLENRYTDYQSYYPHWTLRNLWQLAKYLPLQGIQAEFLNVWRNRDRYPADDPLSPSAVGFAYAFACTMAAQPLAWMEASALPEAAKGVFQLIRQYRSVQDAWHRGQIFPIGDDPSGFTWTGFESCREDGGFVLVYRERHPDAAADLKLWTAGHKPMRFTHVLGTGEDFTATPDEGGRVRFNLGQPMSFGLYRYDAD